jgi:hypothetical protein
MLEERLIKNSLYVKYFIAIAKSLIWGKFMIGLKNA